MIQKSKYFLWIALGGGLVLSKNIYAGNCKEGSISSFSSSSNDSKISSVLDEFSRSFSHHDSEPFLNIIHPALFKRKKNLREIFDGTIAGYSLNKGMIQNNYFYQINYDSTDEYGTHLECGEDVSIQGVIGHAQQYAAIHTIPSLGGSVRLYSLWAPVPESMKKTYQYKYDVGLVHFHVQQWGFKGKTPSRWLQDAKEFSLRGSILSAGVLAHGMNKLLNSNGYFVLRESIQAKQIDEELKEKISIPALQKKFFEKEKDWVFIGFSSVFRGEDIVPGIKFRIPNNESVLGISDKCKEVSSRFIEVVPNSFKDNFPGIVCMAYLPGTSINEPPKAGSRWISFR